MRPLSELKAKMKGIDVVQLTPFNKDESLDLKGMRANTRWLVERAAGKDFIFTPMGSTGEFYAMSDEDCKAVIKMVVEETNGRAIVMAGAGRAGTYETIKLCQYAQSVGADGAQVIIPYYHVPSEEGMYQHFKKVAESVDPNFGIMVYNNPDVSGSWVKPHLMQRLSKIPNVIAAKENWSVNIGLYHAQQRAVNPKDATILAVGELAFCAAALCGCRGFISIMANYNTDIPYSIYEMAMAGDFKKASKIVESIAPLSSFSAKVTANHGPSTGILGASVVMYPSVGKAAMDIVGLRGGPPRLPMVDLTTEEKAELRSILKDIKII